MTSHTGPLFDFETPFSRYGGREMPNRTANRKNKKKKEIGQYVWNKTRNSTFIQRNKQKESRAITNLFFS